MKKIIYISVCCLTALLSASSEQGRQSGENITTQINRDGIDVSGTTKNVGPERNENHEHNYEEVTYQHFLMREESTPKVQASNAGEYAFDVKAARDKEEALEHQRKLEILALENRRRDAIKKQMMGYTRGYCFLDREIFVEKIATYAYFECNFKKPFGTVELTVSVVPEFYAKALIGNPLYVTKDGKRYPVKNGVILTKDKNSINIANFVDDYMTEKVSASLGINGLNAVAKQAQAYMVQRRASDNIQGVVTSSSGLNQSVTGYSRTRKPDPMEYLVLAGIELLSTSAQIIGESYIKSLPYIFKVNKDSIFYADLQFADDNEMEGYKLQQPNIIKREPTFTNGFEDKVQEEQIPVQNNHAGQNLNIQKQSTASNTKSTQYTLPKDIQKKKSTPSAQDLLQSAFKNK